MRHMLTALTLCLSAAAMTPAVAAPNGCPPGLAKKSPACVPPGQAKKGYDDRRDEVRYRYGVGDRIDGDYVIIRDPGRWGLNPDYTYYRTGDQIFRVDRETRQVLDIIGLASALLN
ncbi:excinuclease ABC subunit A [Thalassococcus profundi]|nr:excinuclease ABC subunit A [Thalassococcus profundi]